MPPREARAVAEQAWGELEADQLARFGGKTGGSASNIEGSPRDTEEPFQENVEQKESVLSNEEKNYKKIITIEKSKLDLTNQLKVFNFLKKNKPKFIFIAAAKVGGIYSNNKFKADFIYSNLAIQNNIIHSAYLCGIKSLIFLGSSCVYPRNCKQPIKEKYLLTGKLEQTNDAYAIAKIAGIMMCYNYSLNYRLNYKSLMPPNLFGPGDNYDLKNSHFFPALLKKIYLAKIKRKKKLNKNAKSSP